MEFTEVVSMITTVGFPIVACFAMAYYVRYITDKNNNRLDSLNTAHREEMTMITNAVNNNTLAVKELTILLSESRKG